MTSQASKQPSVDIDLSVYRQLFFEEAEAFLVILRKSLSDLEIDPADEGARQEAHRATHTLKGMASTMRYTELAALAGSLEAFFISNSALNAEQVKALKTGCGHLEEYIDALKVAIE
jgi:chemotaxis protein histidine kinase CheA